MSPTYCLEMNLNVLTGIDATDATTETVSFTFYNEKFEPSLVYHHTGGFLNGEVTPISFATARDYGRIGLIELETAASNWKIVEARIENDEDPQVFLASPVPAFTINGNEDAIKLFLRQEEGAENFAEGGKSGCSLSRHRSSCGLKSQLIGADAYWYPMLNQNKELSFVTKLSPNSPFADPNAAAATPNMFDVDGEFVGPTAALVGEWFSITSDVYIHLGIKKTDGTCYHTTFYLITNRNRCRFDALCPT